MKIARLAMLCVALAAGGVAAYLASGSKPPPAQVVVQAAPPVQTEEVLVAAKELYFGAAIGEADMAWQSWPNTGAGKGIFIRKSENPTALADVKGSLVRGNISSWANRCAATASSRDPRPG